MRECRGEDLNVQLGAVREGGRNGLVPLLLCLLLCCSVAGAEEQAPKKVGDCASGSTIQAAPLGAISEDLRQVYAEQAYERGLQLYSHGNKSAAEAEFRHAMAGRPGREEYVKTLVKFYIQESNYQAAVTAIRDYVSVCGATPLGYELEGELLFQQRRYDEALGAITKSLELFGSNARMHELLGLILMFKHDNSDARSELQKAKDLEPENPETRYFHGRTLYSTGHYAEARDEFSACLEYSPQYRKASENLGLAYQALGDYQQAAQAYEHAMRREKSESGSKHGEPFGYYGSMLVDLGKLNEAVRVLQEGLEFSPKSFVVNFELGRALNDLDQLERAEQFLNAAQTLAPNYAQTHYLLSRIYHRQKRASEAEEELKRFQALKDSRVNFDFPITDR